MLIDSYILNRRWSTNLLIYLLGLLVTLSINHIVSELLATIMLIIIVLADHRQPSFYILFLAFCYFANINLVH